MRHRKPRQDIMTPEQAAEYLRVNRETVYRYIREGKLNASRLGRSYRIPKRSLDLLIWSSRTRQDVTLREYSGEEVAEFVRTDELDEEARAIAERIGNVKARRVSERVPAPA